MKVAAVYSYVMQPRILQRKIWSSSVHAKESKVPETDAVRVDSVSHSVWIDQFRRAGI